MIRSDNQADQKFDSNRIEAFPSLNVGLNFSLITGSLIFFVKNFPNIINR